MKNNFEGQKIIRNRILLVGLFSLFLLPVITAYLWKPASFRNNGDLITPPRMISVDDLQLPNGQAFNNDALLGKWTFVYIIKNTCETDCRNIIDLVENARLTQGKNSKRVRLLLVTLSPEEVANVGKVDFDASNFVVGNILSKDKSEFLSQFLLSSGTQMDLLSKIYLIDPRGNLMMSYFKNIDASDLRKDLSRLLRASRIG